MPSTPCSFILDSHEFSVFKEELTDLRDCMDGIAAGGVVSPGEPIMDIVPRDNRLIINARVNPQDIDVVRAGMPAQVRINAFNRAFRED